MRCLGVLCLTAAVALILGPAVHAVELSVGDDAPNFELTGSDGELYRLSDFKDRKVVVVAWFPKAFTGG